ncbi:MAG: hypothetical protein GY713_21155 [Actinomycetia bacterium]|nr:hypothetical protein [Actinomycetes bacterium]MCP5035929.1 hypothetical protein [Actinomycetes bacterium]
MDVEGPTNESNDQEKLYSPLVRRLAEEFAVDLSTIKGTGPGGRVTRADVQTAAETPTPVSLVAVPDPPDDGIEAKPDDSEPDDEPDNEVGQVEEENEAEPTRAPVINAETFMVSFEVDVSQLVRAQWRLEEVGDLVMPIEALFAALALPALDQFPAMRAKIVDGEVVITDEFALIIDNVGIGETFLEPTTTTPAPLTSVVLKGTEPRSLPELADLVTASTDPSPSPVGNGELSADGSPPQAGSPRGIFTIDHVGSTGATSATPVLRPSTTAAVAYGRPRPNIHLADGAPKERAMMVLGGTFDGRATTTGEAGHFMACLATYLEDPILAFTL